MKKYFAPIALSLLLYACSKGGSPKAVVPTVTTTLGSTATTSVTIGGNITSDGHATITDRGIMLDTTIGFATAKSQDIGAGNGPFSATFTSLTQGTTYYVRAYATNSAGTGYGNTIKLVTDTLPSDYIVTTYAGNGQAASVNGPALQASFNSPIAAVVDPTGVLYVTEGYNTTTTFGPGYIRRIGTDGMVSTFITLGYGGDEILEDATGNLYDLDLNSTLYKITPAGAATPLAGGTYGTKDGQGTAASFLNFVSMDFDKSGNIFISQSKNIRKVTPSGYVSTLPVTATGNFRGIAVDQSENIYVGDGDKIERTDTLGNMTVIAGGNQVGASDGTGNTATFGNNIIEIRLDKNGNLIISDEDNYKIRMVTPTGVVTTIAGTGVKGTTDGSGSRATFSTVTGLAIDASNNIYAVDAGAATIRKITHK